MLKKFYLILIVYIGLALGLFEQCNHLIQLKSGEKIYINSPFYPNSYPLGTSCRYTVHATTAEQQLKFTCRIRLNVPNGATHCQNEAFYFNRDGSELLTNSEYFCGSGEMVRQSLHNRAVISYVSTLSTSIATKQQKIKTKTASTTTKKFIKTHEMPALKSIATTTTTTLKPLSNLVRNSTPEIELNSQESDALTYIMTLLNHTSQFTVPTTTTTIVTANNLTADIISKLMWRDVNVENEYSKGKLIERDARIVSNAIDFGNIIGSGIGGGGGSFSCLVEVITSEQCDCGWSYARLKVAGISTEAAVNEFPAMAGILTKRLGKIICGGTIIHQRYVLSAAHCFTAPATNRAELLRIVAGEHDTSTALESYYTRYYDVEALIVHEEFRSTLMTLRNDIALLRTVQPIEWNRGVGPACLPLRAVNGSNYVGRRKPPTVGQRLDTAGWGTTSFGGPQSMRLLKTTLDVISLQRCRQQLHVVPSHTFCTYTPGSDTCQYDSGGGLYTRRDGRLFVVGVVSYGYACAAQQPSVNVRIAAYLKWIKRNTPDVKYCKK